LLSKPNIKVKAVSSFFSFFRDRLAPFDLALLQSTATSAYYLRRDENAFSSGIIQSEGAWQLEARTNDGNLLKKYSAFGAGKIHLFSESDLLRSQIAKQHPNLIWELYPIKDHFPEIINAMLREAEKLGDNCNQFDPIYLKKAAPEEKLVLQK
jgi:hypothetical protein